MAEIIKMPRERSRLAGNCICERPWEFRKPPWESPYFIQMLRRHSEKLESRNQPHFSLKGGPGYTARSLYVNRQSETSMREIYYLAGLMDCMINRVHPILRTDVLRDMYKKTFRIKAELNVHWYGPIEQVLLPIDSWLYNEAGYRSSLEGAANMKALYRAIRAGTEEMFDILAREYVFYCPVKER